MTTLSAQETDTGQQQAHSSASGPSHQTNAQGVMDTVQPQSDQAQPSASGPSHRASAQGDTQDAQPEADEVDLVQDVESDIAVNEYMEKIMVGVPGRTRFQKIFVRTLNGKKSTKSYTTKDDGPPTFRTPSILPSTEEKEGRPETCSFLVVGIVLAEDPWKYSGKQAGKAGGKAGGKALDKARKERGVLPAQQEVLRAIVPVTDAISNASLKYYVACRSTLGLCDTRVITADAIFFFPEVWTGITKDGDIKSRRVELSAAVKKHAARNKVLQARPQVAIAKSSKAELANRLNVTMDVNEANLLALQHSIYRIRPNSNTLKALEQTAKDLLPKLAAQKPSNEGTVAFYDLNVKMQGEDADKLIHEIKASNPNVCALDRELILQTHAVLRKDDFEALELPYSSLFLFLELMHDRARAGWNPGMLDTVVRKTLHDIEIVNKTRYVTSVWTSSTEDTDRITFMLAFLSSLSHALSEIQDLLKSQATALREQHGGVLKHQSIEDLMLKIGNCLESTSLAMYEEQVLAVHADQLASGNMGAAEHIEELISHIEMVLKLSGEADE